MKNEIWNGHVLFYTAGSFAGLFLSTWYSETVVLISASIMLLVTIVLMLNHVRLVHYTGES